MEINVVSAVVGTTLAVLHVHPLCSVLDVRRALEEEVSSTCIVQFLFHDRLIQDSEILQGLGITNGDSLLAVFYKAIEGRFKYHGRGNYGIDLLRLTLELLPDGKASMEGIRSKEFHLPPSRFKLEGRQRVVRKLNSYLYRLEFVVDNVIENKSYVSRGVFMADPMIHNGAVYIVSIAQTPSQVRTLSVQGLPWYVVGRPCMFAEECSGTKPCNAGTARVLEAHCALHDAVASIGDEPHHDARQAEVASLVDAPDGDSDDDVEKLVPNERELIISI